VQYRPTTSGVYRISLRRGRGAVGVVGRVWRRGWVSPQKKNHFVPKIITLTQFSTGRSFGTQISRFNRKMKLTKKLQKLSKNSRSDQSWGGGALQHRPLNTPLSTTIGHTMSTPHKIPLCHNPRLVQWDTVNFF